MDFVLSLPVGWLVVMADVILDVFPIDVILSFASFDFLFYPFRQGGKLSESVDA